ncbi:MAG: hypothetical protein ACK56D_02050, partial [Planctomycetota bacterium]
HPLGSLGTSPDDKVIPVTQSPAPPKVAAQTQVMLAGAGVRPLSLQQRTRKGVRTLFLKES